MRFNLALLKSVGNVGNMGCIVLLLAIPLITIPSIIYGIIPYFLFPVSFILLLFIGRPSNIQVSLLSLKLTPVVLIVVIPIILYLFTWEILGFAFFVWMLIYYLSRFYTNAHKREKNITEAWKELDSFIKRDVNTYVKNNRIVIAIIIILTVASILGSYVIGGLKGLYFGIFLAVLIWWLTPYCRETIREIRKGDNYGQ